ncbi:MAG: hypothetical protein MUO40_04730 [Anaerolineaceae bacterium]|nr:hypothetical protein [Anaerolineaceae bacterium]
MKNRFRLFFFLLSLIILFGCSLTDAKTTQAPITPLQIATSEPTTLPEVVPSQSLPDQADRWMLYEDALASRLLRVPNVRGAGLCEWEILGQSGQEVYIWAMCQVADDPNGSATSAPVVIRIDQDTTIESVELPRDGSEWGDDVRAMFPEDLWSVIFFEKADIDGMWAHIQLRHTNPEPPLIALEGLKLP